MSNSEPAAHLPDGSPKVQPSPSGEAKASGGPKKSFAFSSLKDIPTFVPASKSASSESSTPVSSSASTKTIQSMRGRDMSSIPTFVPSSATTPSASTSQSSSGAGSASKPAARSSSSSVLAAAAAKAVPFVPRPSSASTGAPTSTSAPHAEHSTPSEHGTFYPDGGYGGPMHPSFMPGMDVVSVESGPLGANFSGPMKPPPEFVPFGMGGAVKRQAAASSSVPTAEAAKPISTPRPERLRGAALRPTLGSGYAGLQSFFMQDTLRRDIVIRNALLYAMPLQNEETEPLPVSVKGYHTFYPLSKPMRYMANTDALPPAFALVKSRSYKVLSGRDGMPYVLRRVDVPITLTHIPPCTAQWKDVRHPGVVTLRDAFFSKEFPGGKNSLCLLYDFLPGSVNLAEYHHLTTAPPALSLPRVPRCGLEVSGNVVAGTFATEGKPCPLPEKLVWSYLLQLLSALRVIHGANLACGGICPRTVLATGPQRIRINIPGLPDFLGESPEPLEKRQFDDLASVADLLIGLMSPPGTPFPTGGVLAVASTSDGSAAPIPLVAPPPSLAEHYSVDLLSALSSLLEARSNRELEGEAAGAPRNKPEDWIEVISVLAARRMAEQIDDLFLANDMLYEELSKEAQNGRLFRLLAKLGFINERPQYMRDTTWSETGDRYLLKLFRDHVFHREDESGKPLVDLGLVVDALNKLDAGIPEKVLLNSRDGQSILVVSYEDLRRVCEESFQDLINPSP